MPKEADTKISSVQKTENTTEDVTTERKTGKVYNALYQGPLPIADIELDCAILDDKENTRIIRTTSVFKTFGRLQRGNKRLPDVPAFVDAKNLQPYIENELRELIKPIRYRSGKLQQYGYKATILPELCEVYLKARREGKLTPAQISLAEKAEILQSSFAKVGMIALIDEATGFQTDRKHDALRLLLAKYIAEGLQKWIKTFPNEFFVALDRLYNNYTTTSRKRPQYYGSFINTYVYKPIEHGYVKKKLDKLNIKDDKKRIARFHQWLTNEGRQVLIHQIGKVQGLMEVVPDIGKFRSAVKKQKQISIAPYLFDDMNKIID